MQELRKDSRGKDALWAFINNIFSNERHPPRDYSAFTETETLLAYFINILLYVNWKDRTKHPRSPFKMSRSVRRNGLIDSKV